MPSSHARLLSEISGKLGFAAKLAEESGDSATVEISAGRKGSLASEMLAAVNFFFCATGNFSTVEPKIIKKETGFFIYQLEFVAPAGNRNALQHLLVLPGGHIPLHSHRESGEIFRFYDELEFSLDGKILSPAPGQEIIVPKGAVHGTMPLNRGFIRAVAYKPNFVNGDFFLANP
jgi:mannose-6-phosphate isomerase-like protein (cupin superfamily)